jgi:hypothetical protein
MTYIINFFAPWLNLASARRRRLALSFCCQKETKNTG